MSFVAVLDVSKKRQNLLSLLVFEPLNVRPLALSSDCHCAEGGGFWCNAEFLVSSFSITVKLKFFSTHVTIIFNKGLNLGETCQGRIVVPWYKKYRTTVSFLAA